MTRFRYVIAAVVLVLVALPVHAEEPEGIGEAAAPAPPRVIPARSTAARIIKPQFARYPVAQGQWRQEGWVVLSYVIRPDGSVGDVLVDESSGVEAFEKAALKAAAAQRFEPATVDGKAVEQCAHKVRYTFTMNRRMGARKSFRGQYRQITAMLEQGDAVGAEAALAQLRDKDAWNLYEEARINLLNYEVCRLNNDLDCQLNQLIRATFRDGAYLELKLYPHVLEQRASVELSAGLYGQVLETLDKRDALKPRLAADHPLVVAGEQIRAAIASGQAISVAGRVGQRSGVATELPFWGHQLLRREFTLDEVSGRISTVDIRCDWRRTTFDFDPDLVWQIPPEWGDCYVRIFGDEQTTFKLVELPVTTAANNP